MLRLKYKVKSSHEGIVQLRNFSRNPKSKLEKVAMAGATHLKQRLIEDMNRPKSGYFYTSLPRQSSGPGESPAIQSGKLRDSLRVGRVASPRNVGRAALSAGFGLPRSYAFYLEFGTSKMAPRAFMRRAVEIWGDEVKGEMRKTWDQL